LISSLKVDRFKSNQDQNDQRPILQIFLAKTLRFSDNV